MQRIGTYMSLKPGLEDRYKEEHRKIWPEVTSGITRFGIRDYSIFMAGRELYSYFEVEDLERTVSMARADPDNQRWQVHMAGFFDVGPGVQDGSAVYPVEVFHSEKSGTAGSSLKRVGALIRLQPGREEAVRSSRAPVRLADPADLFRTGPGKCSLFACGPVVFSYVQSAQPDDDTAVLAGGLADFAVRAAGEPFVRLEEVFYLE